MPDSSRTDFDAKPGTIDESRPRVGVLTFHRCINYGSYWQARCLAEGLKNRGHDAVLLDHVSPRVNVAEWRVALRPTLPTPSPKGDIEEYACKTRRLLAEVEKLPLSKSFSLDQLDEMEEFDTIVIGSDEVWNLRHPWYAQEPAFFGQGLRANRVVTYAASFGNFSCWEGIGSPWTDYISSLDAVSVRDENSWWMLKNSLGIDAPTVLDPCLQFALPPDREVALPAPRYVAVYGHNFSPEFAAEVREWADARKLPLLSIGYRNDWADLQWIAADPHEFSHAIASAEAVATNFFHGCVFALLNRRPFACEISPYRSIKVRGLMELIGGEAHLVQEPARVGALLCSEVETAIYDRLEQVRQTSSAYLREALCER